MAAVAANGISSENQFIHCQPTACNQETEYRSDVRKLVDLLSKLNPLAKEFFPSSYAATGTKLDGRLSADAPVFVGSTDCYNRINVPENGNGNKDSCSDVSSNNQLLNRRRTNGYNQGRKRMNDRLKRAEREESIRRTVYVSDIDHHITEEHLAELFSSCGQVVDCRVCGDPHSTLRFAFIEFDDDEGARAALSLGGAMLGSYLVRVLPSKTAIFPVNPKFLPRSTDEREMVVRTVYSTNIDRKVSQSEVKHFFEQICGEVSRLRLLGDSLHSTRIAFVEFAQAESAILALNCSGMVLGSLPVRISPSKTPVRPRIPKAASQ
ncbi:polyadenylate-binding protein-interacting protein 9 [Dendrobium catenatum]|uniref:Putative polyadenylate-binding protein n=1 Tax=Dendrobium catenatum TaxID=906689 RepID=A0A2I0VXZ4_9ASPA|nr:polyadenylate-binding protein-interacting protein 9 [Dendrobium catenatum]PKU68270.1 putative polyadenylate-binding protein [Dendrobium catenatum]